MSDNEDISDDEEGNYYLKLKSCQCLISILETPATSKVPPQNGILFSKNHFLFLIFEFIYLKERRRIRFADPSSSTSTTTSTSRWSDNTPNEEAEFGTPVAPSEPPQYNAVSSNLFSKTQIIIIIFYRNGLS